MRQLEFVRPGKLEWRAAPMPRLSGDREALVRPLTVARCDLDRAIIRGEAPFRGRLLHCLRNHLPESIGQRLLFKNAPFKGPYPLGHEFLGVVTDIGDHVRTVRPGQLVACSFQICCGQCDNCLAGLTANCTGVPTGSMYGFGSLGGPWGGALSECVRVPFADAMLLPVPAGIDMVGAASLADNIADGWRTVGPWLQCRPGGTVLVVGGGALSVGLYAAAAAAALGSSRVTYMDTELERRRTALSLGVHEVMSHVPDEMRPEYDITVEASASPKGLAAALTATRPGGVCTSVGIYFTKNTPMPLRSMYRTGITFVHGRVHSRQAMDEVVPLLSSGRLPARKVVGVVGDWNDAHEALLDPCAKVVIAREA